MSEMDQGNTVAPEQLSVTPAPHTPLPWSFSPWHIEEGSPAVRAPAGYIVCTTASDNDAKYIARACNSHDALVRALEHLYALVKGECPALLNEDSGGCARLEMDIDAALSAAKGET